MASRTSSGGRGRRYCPVVREGLVCIVDKQDVLRLQIGVNEVQIVKNYAQLARQVLEKAKNQDRPTSNAGEKLMRKSLDMSTGERHKLVRLEKVKHALAVQVGDNADVVPKVEAIAQVDALVPVVRVVRGQR